MFSTKAMDAKFHAMLDQYVPKFATETKLVLPKLRKKSDTPAPVVEVPTEQPKV